MRPIRRVHPRNLTKTSSLTVGLHPLEGRGSILKTAAEVTAAKLRGGFYTPPALVGHALRNLRRLLPTAAATRLLEPGVGDGAFIDGLVKAGFPVEEITALDVDPDAVAVTRSKLSRHGISGKALHQSTLAWSLGTTEHFDAVIGNLPFVRFQFVPAADREAALLNAERLGVQIGGVANLWLPMLLASLSRLRVGGAFSLVLPAECFTGVSAGSARSWLLSNTAELRCDLYPPGSFPGVLQEVVLLSGRRSIPSTSDRCNVTVALHSAQYSATEFDEEQAQVTHHQVKPDGGSWTRLLITPSQLNALDEALAIPAVAYLRTVAKFEVAAVTGANAYFSLRESEVRAYELKPWVRPLLARANQAPGLHFTPADHEMNVRANRVAFLFDSSQAQLVRSRTPGVDDYLKDGENREIDRRYKCRIRQPWYQIPYIKHAQLMLSKRCHYYPRAIYNDTDAVTTDTIYRGRLLTDSLTAPDFVAAFHNSLTLLTAELEGRNFGGGVLELVPSEVGRLSIVKAQGLGGELGRLDACFRESAEANSSENIVWETDLLLQKSKLGITARILDQLRQARHTLQRRRLDRALSEPVQLDS